MSQEEKQLVMRWENDGSENNGYVLPEGISVETFSKRENALDEWLDIVQYGLTNEKMDEEFYKDIMWGREYYNEDICFFLVEDGKAFATISAICNPETKEGYVHMVACKSGYRGRGLGNLLNLIALDTFKKQGMKTAYLTTDDWRIPAIKSYIRCGFVPDTSTDNFKDRWEKIFDILKNKK